MLGQFLSGHGHRTPIARIEAGNDFFRAEETMLILFAKVEGSSTVEVAGNEDARSGDVYWKLALLVVTFFTVWMKAIAGSCIFALGEATKYNAIHSEICIRGSMEITLSCFCCYINHCLFEKCTTTLKLEVSRDLPCLLIFSAYENRL